MVTVGGVTDRMVGAIFGSLDELLGMNFERVLDLVVDLTVDCVVGSSSSIDLLLLPG